MSTVTRPLVGVSIIVIRDGQILLGQRKGSHGENTWSVPGGHLEHGEKPEDCARRELFEETSLNCVDVARHQLVPYVSNIIDGKHYITLMFVTTDTFGNAVNSEPEKCGGWHWFDFPVVLPNGDDFFAPLKTVMPSVDKVFNF